MEQEETIAKYKNGDVICENLLKSMESLNKVSFAKVLDSSRLIKGAKPDKRTHFEAPCPDTFRKNSNCPRNKLGWKCTTCFDHLEYGFDERLYCSCGSANVLDFAFKCGGDSSHDFIVYKKEVVPDLVNNLKSFDGLTILLLGETGVGKTTFINGLANYLSHNYLVSYLNLLIF